MHKLENIIRKANEQGRKAVIPFLTAGFPHPKDFWEHLADLDACGADIIEIGIPFSDPVADGPVVEEASRRALEYGINLADILDELAVRRCRYKADLVLMGYYNPFLQYGLEKLARACSIAGVSGLIIPDLPYDESAPVKQALASHDIALIALVGPNTSLERMKVYAGDAEGYTYVVSVMGITGARQNLAEGVGETIRRAREAFNIPLALGFGLSKPEQLAVLPENAQPDAAVMGSALLKHLDSGKKAAEFLASWLERG